jgi:hypothetical protein
MLHHNLNGLFGRQLLQGHHGLEQFAHIRDRQRGLVTSNCCASPGSRAHATGVWEGQAVMVCPTALRKVMHV